MPQITTHSTRFTLQEGETLLEALERTGHAVEYQCRSGYCGSCRVKLLSGSVTYRECPLALILPNEILTCCCTVIEDIHIDCHQSENQPYLFEPDLFADNSGK